MKSKLINLHFNLFCLTQVLGINYQQDFAFIQMDSPAQADLAVRSEHGRSFMGNQLKVFKARVPDERKIPDAFKNSFDRGMEAPADRRPPPSRSGVHEPMNSVSENDRANDCEIIVHDRSQRAYAEMIERNLKKIGLVVDLLFPNETIPILTLLSSIASRGTLYAVSVIKIHCNFLSG
jgi:RNA recognition motif-containing protein